MSMLQSLFRHENREASPAARRLYARFEIAHTFVDFSAAACFLTGSVMFFFESWLYPATWLFTIGSVLFAAKLTLKLWREIKLYRMEKITRLADRLG